MITNFIAPVLDFLFSLLVGYFCYFLGLYVGATPDCQKDKDTPSQHKKVILCRDQSDIAIIRDVFGDELLGRSIILSGLPDAGPTFLHSIVSTRSCITVVHARAMKHELSLRTSRTPYKDLLNTVRETVGKNNCITYVNLLCKCFSCGHKVANVKLNIRFALGGKPLCFKTPVLTVLEPIVESFLSFFLVLFFLFCTHSC